MKTECAGRATGLTPMGWEEHPFAVGVMLLMGWYSLCAVHRPADEAGLTGLLEEGGSRDIFT